MGSFRLIATFLIITVSPALAVSAQELKPEEIITKHIESIGKKEVLDRVSTLFAVGTSSFESQSPAVKGGGKAIIVSDRDNLMLAFSLNSRDYPFEKIGFFHDKVTLPFITAGQRSLLGEFLVEHPRVLSEGLFGGTMTLRWPIRVLEQRKSKLKMLGTKKIERRKMFVLAYQPDGGGLDEFSIKLYFDAETFEHVQTVYHREVAADQPKFGQGNQLANSELTLTERYSDFKAVDGLTLPYTYSVEFASNSTASSYKTTWGIKVSQYYINQKLTPDFFTFDVK
jgi:hypothetical protein